MKIANDIFFGKACIRVQMYRNRKKGRKKNTIGLLEAMKATVKSIQSVHTLTFLKRYLIHFVMSPKVGLIKGFSIQQLCISAYL